MKLKAFVQNGVKMVLIGGMLTIAGCDGTRDRVEQDARKDHEQNISSYPRLSLYCEDGSCLDGALKTYGENKKTLGKERAYVNAIRGVRSYHANIIATDSMLYGKAQGEKQVVDEEGELDVSDLEQYFNR